MGAEPDLAQNLVSDTSIVIKWRRQICRAQHSIPGIRTKLAKTGHMWIYIIFSVFFFQSLASYEIQIWENTQKLAILSKTG